MSAELLGQIGLDNFGKAIMTAVSVAGLAICGGYTFSYAAHAIAAVAEGTAAGQKEIAWPDEPLVDRFGKAVILLWLVLVGAALPFIIGKIIAGEGIGTWIFTLCGLGLFFPIVFLSTQSSHSMWNIIDPDTLGRLLKRPEHLAMFYVMVAPAVALLGVGIWIMVRFHSAFVPLAALIVAMSILIWARLLGRLAHLTSRMRSKRRSRVDDEVEPDLGYLGEAARRASARSSAPARRGDTDAVRDLNDSEPATGPATPSLKRVWVEEGADDPYMLADGPTAPTPPELPKEWMEPPEHEMKLALRNRPVPPPSQPWLMGTYSFPFDPNNWKAVIWLTAGLTVTGWFLRVFV
jgi:hypothetical protein